MARITGTTVTLYEETQSGTDAFGNPVITSTPKTVENVLVAEPSTDDVTSSISLYGKKIAYTLGIPKGDTHDWVDKKVEWTDAYGNTFTVKTFGYPVTGIEANVPGQWHMKVKCEAYG
jgi:hypothetical protein